MKKWIKRFTVCLTIAAIMGANTTVFAAGAADVLTLPESLKIIEDEAFYGTASVEKVVVPGSVTEIGMRAFAQSSLAEITLNEGLTQIGEGAFMNCTVLKTVDVPESCTVIGKDAFNGCTGMTGIDLPDNITVISSGAFAACSSVQNIALPKSVTRIENGAFAGCTSLRKISLSKDVEFIATDAFSACAKLTVTVVEGSYAHSWCRKNKVPFKTDDDWETEIISVPTIGANVKL